MILYRLTEPCDAPTAAHCTHPKLARLKGAGPWAARTIPGGGVELWLMLGKEAVPAWPRADELGEERPTHDGMTYRLAKTLPPIETLAASDIHGHVLVRLHCGVTLPVMPAYMGGHEITAAGVLGGAASDYGRIVEEVSNRVWETKMLPPVLDPRMLTLARAALRSCFPRLTDEAIEAYRLLSTRDVYPLFEAATAAPKADPAGAG